VLGAGVDETVNAYKIWSKNLEKKEVSYKKIKYTYELFSLSCHVVGGVSGK
jgi:hypothetical protein